MRAILIGAVLLLSCGGESSQSDGGSGIMICCDYDGSQVCGFEVTCN